MNVLDYVLQASSGLSLGPTVRRPLAERSTVSLNCSRVNCSAPQRLPDFHSTNMSAALAASRSSILSVTDHFDEQGERLLPSPNFVRGHEASDRDELAVDSVHLSEGELQQKKLIKRQFCNRCDKAALLCICHHVKLAVNNKTSIVILQHPDEKKHHLGSARIAVLALQNVQLISVPEVDRQISCRIRGKVPGSKRFIAGRGGKIAQHVNEASKKGKAQGNCVKIQPSGSIPNSEQQVRSDILSNRDVALDTMGTFQAENGIETSCENYQLVQWSVVPPWISLQPDAGLLFPSEKAVDLWPTGLGLSSSSDSELSFHSEPENLPVDGDRKGVPAGSPSQMIVLDGTWSKAKRIFFENPWLHSLPHYRLPTLQPSRYGRLRNEPKPGCLSTIESIVYALQLLEPETRGLESLVDVFDSMIEDQVRFVTANRKGRPSRKC